MCVVCTSCVSQHNMISTSITMVEKSPNEELMVGIKDYRYVKLDCSTEESIIKSADRVLCSKEKIYVVDRSKNVIIAYDNNGNFVSSTKRYIGRAGNEYINILDAAFDENKEQIYAYADNPSQIMIFDKSLRLKEIIPTEQLIREIAADEKNVYVLFYDISDYNDVKVELRSYVKGNWSEYSVLLEQKNIINGVGCIGKFITSSNECCCLSMPFDNHIYVLKNGQIDNVLEVDFHEKWFDFTSSKDMLPMEFLEKNRDKNRCITNICYTDSILLFNTNIHKYYVINKNTLKGSVYSNMHIPGVAFSAPLFTPTCGSKGLFVEMVSPSRIIDYVKICEERGLNYENEETKELFKSISINDNPILIICNLK